MMPQILINSLNGHGKDITELRIEPDGNLLRRLCPQTPVTDDVVTARKHYFKIPSGIPKHVIEARLLEVPSVIEVKRRLIGNSIRDSQARAQLRLDGSFFDCIHGNRIQFPSTYLENGIFEWVID